MNTVLLLFLFLSLLISFLLSFFPHSVCVNKCVFKAMQRNLLTVTAHPAWSLGVQRILACLPAKNSICLCSTGATVVHIRYPLCLCCYLWWFLVNLASSNAESYIYKQLLLEVKHLIQRSNTGWGQVVFNFTQNKKEFRFLVKGFHLMRFIFTKLYNIHTHSSISRQTYKKQKSHIKSISNIWIKRDFRNLILFNLTS